MKHESTSKMLTEGADQGHKDALCREIGNFFGEFSRKGDQLCVDNGEQVFQYNSPDELLADWVDTLVAHQQTGATDWEQEIEFIYRNVVKKWPVGVSPVVGKKDVHWKCSIDVKDGSAHGKNLHLGTYDTIAEAVSARQTFETRAKAAASLQELEALAKDIQLAAKERKKTSVCPYCGR